MKAAIFDGPGRLRVAEVPRPAPGAGEVIVKVAACGICGSDLQLYRGVSHNEGGGNVLSTPDGAIPGHEWSGEIVELGDGVHNFSVGDRVCGAGFGAFAEYVPVPVSEFTLTPLPDDVSFGVGATVEPLADALRMVNLAEPKVGENAIVFGVGIIGLGVVQALAAQPNKLDQIVAVDVSAHRLNKAAEIGATATINAATEDVLERAAEICGTAPIPYPQMEPPAVDMAFDCVGYIKGMPEPPVIQSALACLRARTLYANPERQGRVVCFGSFEDKVTVDMMPVIFKQPLIMGSLGYMPEDLVTAVQYMKTARVDRSTLISHRYPLNEITAAFEQQGSYEESIKVLVIP